MNSDETDSVIALFVFSYIRMRIVSKINERKNVINGKKSFILTMNCEKSVNTFANSCYRLHFR